MQVEFEEMSALGESVELRQVIVAEDAHRDVETQADVAKQTDSAGLQPHEQHECEVYGRMIEERAFLRRCFREFLLEKL